MGKIDIYLILIQFAEATANTELLRVCTQRIQEMTFAQA